MGLLRFFLALTVAYAHGRGTVFGNTIFGGDLSVQSFFVFSGFYITMVIFEKYSKIPGGALAFYKNRILRLFPTYLIVALLTVVIAFGMNTTPYAHAPLSNLIPHWQGLNFFQKFFLVFTNLFMVGQDWVMYLGWKFSGVFGWTTNFRATEFPAWRFLLLPHGWSLGLEITFYLIAPFLVARKLLYLWGVFGFSIGTRYLLAKNGLDFDPWTYRFFPNELALFMAGSLSYRLYQPFKKTLNESAQLRFWVNWVGWMCVISALVCMARFHFIPLPLHIKKIVCYSAFAFAIPLMFEATKDNRIDRFLGDLAYPIYVCHLLVYMTCQSIMQEQVLFATALVLVFSVILTIWVEKPFLKLRRSFAQPSSQRSFGSNLTRA